MLTERDIELLKSLEWQTDHSPKGARITPAYLGGGSGSHHSGTLTKLAKRGLVDRKKLTFGRRGSCSYAITEAGRKAILEAEGLKT